VAQAAQDTQEVFEEANSVELPYVLILLNTLSTAISIYQMNFPIVWQKN